MRKQVMLVLFRTILLALLLVLPAINVHAATLDRVMVTDSLQEDLSIIENISIELIDNTKSTFTFVPPKSAMNVTVFGYPYAFPNGTLQVSLNCSRCVISIVYRLNKVITPEFQDQYLYSRTLSLPKSPSQLAYRVRLPEGFIISNQTPVDQEAVIPPDYQLVTDGRHIELWWEQQYPELPKIFNIHYHGPEVLEGPFDFAAELSEPVTWILMAGAFLAGCIAMFFGYGLVHRRRIAARKRMQESTPAPIPLSLLTPDERTVVNLLKEHSGKLGQKEIVAKLQWSKSKVSAIMTNLDSKKIVSREKVGRNYRIQLARELDE